jgi:two-component system sensor histidine kinase YesM
MKFLAYFTKNRASKRVSITRKLILLFLFVSLIPVTTIQIINYYNTVTVMERKVKEYAKVSLIQTAKNIQTELSAYEDLLYQVTYDDSIIELLAQLNATNDAAIRNKMQRKFTALSYSKKWINSVLVIGETGDYVISIDRTGQDINLYYWKNLGDLTKIELYQKSIQCYTLNAWESTKLLGHYEDTPYYSFFLSRRIIDFNTNTPLGVAVLSIGEPLLRNVYTDSQCDARLGSNTAFIVDSQGNVVSHPSQTMIGKNIRNMFSAPAVEKLLRSKETLELYSRTARKKVIIYSAFVNKAGWRLINVIDRSYLFREIYFAKNLMLLVESIAGLILLMAAIGISNQLTVAVKKIVNVMAVAQKGDLNVRVDVKGKDEFAVIAARFNMMMEEIKALVEEVKKVSRKEKETAIKMLEMQINPHFLYNTLDSINWMAIEKEEYEISDSLNQLAAILRYSISRSNQIVTVKMEIEWLQNYLSLQKCRFSNSFNYYIHMEPKIMDCQIHKLLFQPFIENSIIHGLAEKSSGGVLEITGKINFETEMEFIIRDNGKGMSQSVIDRVFEPKDNDPIGIGINNAISRLKLYYQDRYRISVKSVIGAGTTINIIIPINWEADDSDENRNY